MRPPEGPNGANTLSREVTLSEERENMEELIAELKIKIINTLSLMDVTPEDIGDDTQLVGGTSGSTR